MSKKKHKHSAFFLRLHKALKSALKDLRNGTADCRTVSSEGAVPPLINVLPMHDYWLLLFFANGEIRLYDCIWALQEPSMEKMKDTAFFKRAHVGRGGVKWNKKIILGPEVLYGNSTPLTDDAGRLLKFLQP